ncbi:Formate dehydrogenase major subunit [Helcobacillus massiliensis]|uniref:Formate dehydrogenase major subunit n=1 Tax=Helcobacillus massiliensis TaxID=521392 RepID=A0A839QR56_9MICO|nr:formate dehydrogenase major subunit [Helcobacillus massiliensis]
MARITPLNWPAVRQLTSGDLFGRGPAVKSQVSEDLTARTVTADSMAHSVCPYCAVGCGQRVYTKDNKVIQIEGNPDSPHSRGRLCPKGAASEQLVNSPGRITEMLYRAPRSTKWEKLDLDTAMEMIADRFIEARRNHWREKDDQGRTLRHTLGIASLGGATIDNEENYLAKKLFTAAGAIQMENQARI